MILEVIYDPMFYGFSHGFRRGHSQHQALNELREKCRKMNVRWVGDVDVSGFFDNIDKGLLLSFIKRKVNDGGIIRLIGKWLNAGVLEEGILTHPEKGTPQGGVATPRTQKITLSLFRLFNTNEAGTINNG